MQDLVVQLVVTDVIVLNHMNQTNAAPKRPPTANMEGDSILFGPVSDGPIQDLGTDLFGPILALVGVDAILVASASIVLTDPMAVDATITSKIQPPLLCEVLVITTPHGTTSSYQSSPCQQVYLRARHHRKGQRGPSKEKGDC